MDTAIGTAQAAAEDGSLAGERAASDAVAELPGDRVDFCQVFCSVDYDYERVVEAVRDVVGSDAELIGCSAAETFTEDSVEEGAVAVAAVASDTLAVFTGVGEGLSDNVRRAVREAVDDLPGDVEGYPYRSAITLHDGLSSVGEELAIVCQQKLGPEVTVAGGAAADDHLMEATHVFHGDRTLEDAVVVALIAGEERPVVSVAHGHEPLTEPVEVTSADERRVHELDGRPAFQVWKDAVRESVREEFGADVDELDADDQLLQRILCEYEFGIDQGERYKMRWPWIEAETGDTLHFAVDVPEGTVLRVMHGTEDEQIESARTTARRALRAAGDTEMAGGFIYDCACRGIVLGDEFPRAVAAIDDELGLPFSGFETYGETCMGPGEFSGFHNNTTVALLLPK
ncbi:FIST signal transduction protein [Halomicrobium salinisoli]|uniref:FIST signal transduction protein n=1 Tax=Halomicrobium salinisoli TaxID=2878391 RepID=UPI001CF08ED8|nr:FIST N-terminal domain-containing protein [Halomicrobium salinisoli]